MVKKLIAESIGTFILVFLGTRAIVIKGPDVGKVGIALAFGLGVIAAARGIGAVSGEHLNPAVSIGMLGAGRMQSNAFVCYMIAQVVGGIGAILVIMALGRTAAGGMPAVIYEFGVTFLFATVILGATAKGGAGTLAGLAIGLTLVLIDLAGIHTSGASVNPALSLAPALFVGGAALAQIWPYTPALLSGGLMAGAPHRSGFASTATAAAI